MYKINSFILRIMLLTFPVLTMAQEPLSTDDWESSPGVIGVMLLTLIVAFVAVMIMSTKISNYVDTLRKKQKLKSESELKEEIINLESEKIDELLEQRKAAHKYHLPKGQLMGDEKPIDERGLVNKATHEPDNPFIDEKLSHETTIPVSAQLRKVIVYYIGAAAFWLIFGTFVGEYLGFKFIWPEIDKIPWLSFGRLRPVHTNTVFWGWSSLAMIGLAHFVIARTSNREIYSYKWAWTAWYMINASVILGNICLMAGINNGGAEFREYIWPVFALFALALVVIVANFYKTVSLRKTKEIYISNWYILAALIWTIILVTIGYLPFNQEGLGETVIQGYFMHQGVGMWFMTFCLGLIYYYLPSSLNKPIYSYALGVLAFWTQMLFYTMIGTHHFIFSPLPWWLQTVAIVFSMGMFIPVTAGTTNFLMTMKGSWDHISKSYVLPFFLVGVVFYFVGSGQGSFQAFRYTNYMWHFTDFNVAHSHMTMYGIIAFILWACIYWLLPKVTGREPRQVLVGAHFWLAFIGLFAYMISMMLGGSLRGLSWIENNPFIMSVILMREYWVWRAVGGTMMFLSHCVFAYNFWIMVKAPAEELETEKVIATV